MSLSNDIKALQVQHSIPFLLREPLSRVLDALEKRTEALDRAVYALSEGDHYSRHEALEIARAALAEGDVSEVKLEEK